MITINKIKFIRSLRLKKNRRECGCFVVEGDKIVADLLHSDRTVPELFAKTEWLAEIAPGLLKNVNTIHEVSHRELKKISNLTTPHEVLAIVKMPPSPGTFSPDKQELVLALDGIQDPGNMGTIIRTASWFGIRTMLCSEACADVYNPKVIQASMSGFINVTVLYIDLKEVLKTFKEQGIPVMGTFPDGENLYRVNLPAGGLLVLGNESRGISRDLYTLIDRRLSIPAKTTKRPRPMESLNVATAAGIICSELRRRSEGGR